MGEYSTAVSHWPIETGGQLNFTTTSDGKRVRYALWPDGTKGLVIFLNGRNEYIEKYNCAYSILQKKGFAVVALDWRGQGLSDRSEIRDNYGHVNSFEEFQLDLQAVLSESSVKSICGRRIVLAHSTGGCIAHRAVKNEDLGIERAVFLAPLWGGFTIQKLMVFLGRAMSNVGLGKISSAPKTKSPYILRTTIQKNVHTSDPVQFDRLQRIIASDSRLSIGPPTFSWLSSVGKEIEFLTKYPHLKIPHLVLIGSEDWLISIKEVKKIVNQNELGIFEVIPNARHELLIEKPFITELVWSKIGQFLEK